MAIIRKKCWPGHWFDDIASGKKSFDLRLDDFDVVEGDTLILEEWDPETEKYTGRVIEKKVTYVMKLKPDNTFWAKEDILEKGMQIMSLGDSSE